MSLPDTIGIGALGAGVVLPADSTALEAAVAPVVKVWAICSLRAVAFVPGNAALSTISLASGCEPLCAFTLALFLLALL